MPGKKQLRVAALGDLHVTERAQGAYQQLFTDISHTADVLLLCGDLTDHGLPSEAQVLRQELEHCTIPKAAVLGNHDCDRGLDEEIQKILRDGNLVFLEEENIVLENIGFTGVKGFAGGFGKYMLGSFGEDGIKNFVAEAISEAEQLEVNLGEIEHTAQQIVIMHYSPIMETLKGESTEIFPFLGSSRFEEVINRFEVCAVFHGHAHYGHPEGKTSKGIPVFNAAYPLMQKTFRDKPYRLYTIPLSQ